MARYELSPGSSRLVVEARSSVHPIRVEATELGGGFDAEVDGGGVLLQPGARLEVRVGDLRSGNLLVDQETRRRLDPRRHPTLTGELTSARLASPGVFACEGRVTFQGRTQEVAGDLRVVEVGEDGVGLEGEQHVDVRRWGVRPPRLLLMKVEPVVLVRLEVRGTRVGGFGRGRTGT